MVASGHPLASQVGADVLARGGNAIDAAVAVGFALAVVLPEAGNIGGGGYLVHRDASGKAVALDYRETAPAAATRDMYLGPDGKLTDQSRIGHLAAGVPGSVAGLAAMHERLGSSALARAGRARDRARARPRLRRRAAAQPQGRGREAHSAFRRRSTCCYPAAFCRKSARRSPTPTSRARSSASPSTAPTASIAARPRTWWRPRWSVAAGSSRARTSRRTGRSGASRSASSIAATPCGPCRRHRRAA